MDDANLTALNRGFHRMQHRDITRNCVSRAALPRIIFLDFAALSKTRRHAITHVPAVPNNRAYCVPAALIGSDIAKRNTNVTGWRTASTNEKRCTLWSPVAYPAELLF
jgi:hypothetical protein